MATDKSKKTKASPPPKDGDAKKTTQKGSEMLKRTEKLFADLGTLATNEAPAESKKATQKKASKKTASSPAETEEMKLRQELALLRARIRELEMHDEAKPKTRYAPSIIYEDEKIGYAFEKDTLNPIRGTNPDRKPKNPLQAPLTSTGTTIGNMLLDADEDKQWQPEEEELLKNVAQQASLQIQSLRLLSAAERARLEAEEATRRFMHENWDNYLDAIHQNEKIGYAYDQASVTPFLDDTDPDTYQATVKVMEEQIGKLAVKHTTDQPLNDDEKKMVASVAEQVAQQVENIRLLADAARARAEAEEATRRLTQESWQEFAARNQDEQILSFIYDNIQVSPLKDGKLPENVNFSVPIEVRGAKIGELAVAGEEKINQESFNLAQEIASRTSLHIESLRLLEETERGRQQLDKRAAELETVAKVSTAAAAIREPESLLRSVVDLTNYSFKLFHTSVFLLEELEDNTKILNLFAASGRIGQKLLEQGLKIDFNQKKSVVAKAARELEAIVVTDTEIDSFFLTHPQLPQTRSEMAIPMVVADKLIGIFDVQSEKPHYFTEEDMQTYTTLASQTAVALQNAQLYDEQIATVSRLRELDHLKSSFLANMSHELRTPLNSISGFTQVMLEGLDGDLTNEMEEDLGLIDKNANHLLNLINEVLDMAKIEAGRLSVTVEPTNLYQILEDVVKSTAPLARGNKLSMELENKLDPEQIIIIDGMRIQQVMINLIGNSMKFTKDGGIHIHAEQVDEIIRIVVRDTGIGIPPDQTELIFEAFSQVDTSTTRKVGGTGLGLPISRRFVEMHNGRLWAESTGVYGEGSVFTLELPVILPETEE